MSCPDLDSNRTNDLTPLNTPQNIMSENVKVNQQCEYANDGNRITSPGKFEGEPVFAPYLWSMGLEGFSDEDTGTEYRFKFTNKGFEDSNMPWAKELRQWLGRKRRIRLYEDSQGFVHCIH